jgi:TRAP-type mannitol/chloroaromatic compound transport system substrate-binding protein
MSLVSRRGALGAAVASTAALAAPAIAQGRREWRLVTSWPKNLPGPGVTAQRLADRIAALSDGRLTLRLFPAGELVPALEVFDAVTSGTADAAHTASLYWQGKAAAAVFYTTVPFGLLPSEHLAWLEQGGGQALWDELYAPFGIKPFVGGNTGPSMGGWFPKPLASVEDLRGLKIRVQGLGGEIYRRLGATPVSIPAGELSMALSSGVIDAVEFLSPSSDLAVGLQRSAKNYYWPGFNKPNGASELLVARREWEGLPKDLAAIVEHACKTEHAFALGEIQRMNEEAYAALLRHHGVKSVGFPPDLVAKARTVAEEVVAELGTASPIAGRVLESYRLARARSGPWSAVSLEAFLDAREA